MLFFFLGKHNFNLEHSLYPKLFVFDQHFHEISLLGFLRGNKVKNSKFYLNYYTQASINVLSKVLLFCLILPCLHLRQAWATSGPRAT